MGSLDTVPVGTLPKNGFCCCPASELGVVLLAAGLMVRGVAMLPSSKDAVFCWAKARSGKIEAMTMMLQSVFDCCLNNFIVALSELPRTRRCDTAWSSGPEPGCPAPPNQASKNNPASQETPPVDWPRRRSGHKLFVKRRLRSIP